MVPLPPFIKNAKLYCASCSLFRANSSKIETASEYFFSLTKSVAILKSLSEFVTCAKEGASGSAGDAATGAAISTPRRRLRVKVSDPWEPGVQSQIDGHDELRVAEIPDVGEGGRTPSDWEAASEDEHVGDLSNGDVRVELDQAIDGLRGSGPLTENDEQALLAAERNEGVKRVKRGAAMQDVGLVKDRKVEEFTKVLRKFLETLPECRGRKFRISFDEASEIWNASQKEICSTESVVDRIAEEFASLGRRAGNLKEVTSLSNRLDECFAKKLVDLLARIQGYTEWSGVSGHKKQLQLKIECVREVSEKFERFAPRPQLYFDCSMLQTMERKHGKVTWRDVKCGRDLAHADKDDLLGLWDCREDEIRKGDTVLYALQDCIDQWQSPVDMLNAHKRKKVRDMGEGIVLSCTQTEDRKRVCLDCDNKQYVFDRMKGDTYWKAVPQALRHNPSRNNQSEQLDNRNHFDACDNYSLVVLKTVPERVAKYDVQLRESPLHAVHAMHAMTTNMVHFTCKECNERFPAFHPAFTPPAHVAKDMEILRHRKDGLATCSMEVAQWDELPPMQNSTGLAFSASGMCLRCRKDIDEQSALTQDVIALRSAENHMDPLFRFPIQDLQELFANATLTEAMLVALDLSLIHI